MLSCSNAWQLQIEIDSHLISNKNDDDNFLIYTDIDELDTHLDQSFNAFKKQTADPVWMLRDDLQYWVREYVGAGEINPGEHPDVIKQQVGLSFFSKEFCFMMYSSVAKYLADSDN